MHRSDNHLAFLMHVKQCNRPAMDPRNVEQCWPVKDSRNEIDDTSHCQLIDDIAAIESIFIVHYKWPSLGRLVFINAWVCSRSN